MNIRRMGIPAGGLPAMIAAAIFLGLSLAPRPAQAGCPPNSHEIGERTETADEIRIKCRCNVGFWYRENQCKRHIPQHFVIVSTPFIVVEKKGIVRAFIKRGGLEFEVKVKNALAATDITTGANSYVVFQLPNGKRLAIGPNSKLELGDKLVDYDLNIKSANGVFRLQEPTVSRIYQRFDKIAERAFQYSQMWRKNVTGRRFRIWTPHWAMAVQGTDFVILGSPNGDLTIRVIEGAVDLTPHDAKSGPTVTIETGEQGFISKDGKIKKLAKVDPGKILGQWTAQTGLKDLPFYGK